MATRPTGVQARFLGLSYFRPNSRGQFSPKPDVYEKFKGAFFILERPPPTPSAGWTRMGAQESWWLHDKQPRVQTVMLAKPATGKLISLCGVWAVRPAKPKKYGVWCDVYLRSCLGWNWGEKVRYRPIYLSIQVTWLWSLDIWYYF